MPGPGPRGKRPRTSGARPERPCSGSAAAAWTRGAALCGRCAADVMLLAAPLLLLLLRCPAGDQAAALHPRSWPAAGRPAPPAPPQGVRFQAHTFQHLLLWAPGGNASRRLLYDVQYKRYGNHSWTLVSHCIAIARRSCDLTAETSEPSRRYFARVRAMAPDGSSSRWTPTGPFSPKEATLQLWNMSLSLSGNILRVTLGLPIHRGKNSTVAYDDLHPGGWDQYRVYVRRTSSNTEYEHMETNRTFELPALLWGEQYCISVEPHLASRPNPTKRTEEQCISTPLPKDSTSTMVTLASALLSLVALGIMAVAWAWAYLKKPVETPSVLESFQKQTSPWLPSEPWTLGMSGWDLCLEVGSIHPISLGLKDHSHPAGVSSLASSSGAAGPVPEKVMPEAMASGRAESPWLRDLTDSSGGSTDSGICLREPLGSSSLLLPTRPLTCGGPLPGSHKERGNWEDHGHEVEGQLLQGAAPGSQEEPVGRGSEETLKQAKAVECQRQARGPVEVLGSSSCPPTFEATAQSKPILASGYLKQASVAIPSAPEVGLGASLGSLHQGRLHFLSSVALGGSESLPCLPEFPKALLASSFLEQEPVWPPPHLSLLHSSAHLSLSLPWCHM